MGLKGWAGNKSCCLSPISRKLCFKDKRKWKMPQKTKGGEFSPAPQRKRRIHLSRWCGAQNANSSLSGQPCLTKEIRLTGTEKTPSINLWPVHMHMNTQIHTHKSHTWTISPREQNGDRQSTLQLGRHNLLSSWWDHRRETQTVPGPWQHAQPTGPGWSANMLDMPCGACDTFAKAGNVLGENRMQTQLGELKPTMFSENNRTKLEINTEGQQETLRALGNYTGASKRTLSQKGSLKGGK